MDRRIFLRGLAAGSALAAAPAVEARPALSGEVRRTRPDRVALDWAPRGERVTVRVSADPNASPASMRLVQAANTAGRLEAAAPVSPRPYYLLTTQSGVRYRVAERLLPLEGGRNFRDMGGYRAVDGRQVRWGKLYRSGVMTGLTPADMTYLQELGVRVICDLRSSDERRVAPNPFISGGAGPAVAATDYKMFSFEDITRAPTRAAAIEGFARSYVGFTEGLAPQYTDMFARLSAGEAPLAVNCSAGKDRTGMASALILSVLGVPRPTVIADYALTERYAPATKDLASASHGASLGLPPERAKAFANMTPAARDVMGGSDPAVMRRALAILDQRFGGPVALTKASFGMTDAKIARMRRLYLA